MITLSEIRLIALANIPYDKGFMYMNGTRFSEDSTKFSIVYDGNAVPYIPYTEFVWKAKRWNGAINPNEGWIRNNTVNDLDHIINTAYNGEKSLIMKKHERTVVARARENKIAQGTLQSLKGNKR